MKASEILGDMRLGARPLPLFSECPKAYRHSWIRRGFAARVAWVDLPDGSREGRTVPGDVQDTSVVGAICAFCGQHERLYSPYPQPVAPMVAP